MVNEFQNSNTIVCLWLNTERHVKRQYLVLCEQDFKKDETFRFVSPFYLKINDEESRAVERKR